MLEGKKILLTGAAGNIGFPLGRSLAEKNEVWGISRFSDAAERNRVNDAGLITRDIDLGEADFGDLPDDFDYLLHLAAAITGDDYDRAVQVNAEGTALVMQHCRKAKAALVMSSTNVFRPNPDPLHAFLETDPLGDAPLPGIPFYSITKIVEEGAARAAARMLNLPTVIARMNVAYGPTGKGGLPGRHFDMIRRGEQVSLRWEPNTYSPIHDRDIFEQTEAMLGAASVPATIVNWGGDEVVSAQQWCQYFGEVIGVTPDVAVKQVPGAQRGVVLDNQRRMAITGPCKIDWRDGMRELAEAHLTRGV